MINYITVKHFLHTHILKD